MHPLKTYKREAKNHFLHFLGVFLLDGYRNCPYLCTESKTKIS